MCDFPEVSTKRKRYNATVEKKKVSPTWMYILIHTSYLPTQIVICINV